MKRGFTLIELLAVIVILAVIAVIAVPQVLKVIETSRQDAFRASVRNSFNAMEIEVTKGTTSGQLSALNIKNNPFKTGTWEYNSETKEFSIIDANVGTNDTRYIMQGERTKTEIMSNNNFSIASTATMNVSDPSGANSPRLSTGMIAVRYDGTNWVKADTTNVDNNWYNYSSQQWANAVSVNQTASTCSTCIDSVTKQSRTDYQSAAEGTAISMDDINTMWVWIPRYSYTKKGTYGNGGTSASSPGSIDIKFVSTSIKDNGDAAYTTTIDNNTDWLTHPTFTFGSTELAGIWVGKFETTGSITNSTTAALTIKPNLQSVRSQPVKVMYESVKNTVQGNTSVYGFTNDNDTHMMKNMEWGAVAYLTQSIYGKYGNPDYSGSNKEVYLNNSSSYYTGRSSGSVGGSGIITPTNEYISAGYYTYDGKCAAIHANLPSPCSSGSTGQTISDKNLAYGASTTGNIYGIYDMSGGSYEYVMGMYNPTTLANPSTIRDCSGYSSNYAPPIACPSTSPYDSRYDTSDLSNLPIKYYDRYLGTSSIYGFLGDGTKEVSSWYGDSAYFVGATSPWFLRGGYYLNGVYAGAFYYKNGTGGANSYSSFRLVQMKP